jgi:hypothetical protein
MRRVFLLRYKTKPEHATENKRLVRAVFDEIHRVQPEGIRYSTFLLDDGLTFVNIVATETSSGLAPLGKLQAYRRIQHDKYDRFDEPPQVTELHELGTYRVFDD